MNSAMILDMLSRRWGGEGASSRSDAPLAHFATLQEAMGAFLREKGIAPRAFSHFGLVIADTEAALHDLAQIIGGPVKPSQQQRVEAYRVQVTRLEIAGTEVEFIEPAGESFFQTFLNSHGEGLQHLSFWVTDIAGCLQILAAAGETLLDPAPRAGSHGKVAFIAVKQFSPLLLELCQPPDR